MAKQKYTKSNQQLYQTDSQDSSNNLPYSHPHPDLPTHSHQNFTTYQNIKTYFSHFLPYSKSFALHPDSHFSDTSIFKPPLLNCLQIDLNETTTKKSDNNFQETSQDSDQIKDQVLNVLKSYQMENRLQIEKQLLRSGRFSKADSFSSQLIIHSMSPSKHYEIVTLEIQLLWYKTSIRILNTVNQSPLHSCAQVSASGSFGSIYLIRNCEENYAVKCIQLAKQSMACQKIDLNTHTLVLTIKEYFFLLLFSELHISPKIKTIGGFDLIVHRYCIEFAAQICFRPQFKKPQKILQSLWKIHMLQVVHRDVKPTNIMYSPTFQTQVFIDFGCASGLNQCFGSKSISKFVGTTVYCSEQVLSLLKQQEGRADLYYNDIFGLQKSINQKYHQFGSSQDLQIHLLSNPFFSICQIKFNLYDQKIYQIQTAWNEAKSWHYNSADDIEIEIMKFIWELNLSDQLRTFYWAEISDSVRRMEEFQDFGLIFKQKGSNKGPKFFTSRPKEQKFKETANLYDGLDKREQQIGFILSRKQNIQSFIKNLIVNSLNINQSNSTDFNVSFASSRDRVVRMCLIVANYASLSHQRYKISIQNKIKACNAILGIIQSQFPSMHQQKANLMPRVNQKMQPLFQFYLIYFFRIIRYLPENYIRKEMISSVISLYLLGFPYYSNSCILPLYMEFLNDVQSSRIIRNFALQVKSPNCGNELFFKYQSKQISYSYQKCCQPTKEESQYQNFPQQYEHDHFIYQKKEQIKISAQSILGVWEFLVISQIFNRIFYSQHNHLISQIDPSIDRQNCKCTIIANDSQEQKLLQLILSFFDSLYQKNSKITFSFFNDIFSTIQSEQIIKLSSRSFIAKKAYTILCFHVCAMAFAFNKAKTKELIKNLRENLIFSVWSYQELTPHLMNHQLYRLENSEVLPDFLDKADQVIGCYQLSARFQIEERMFLALKRKDFQKISTIVGIVVEQVNKNFKQETEIPIAKNTIKPILVFLQQNYLKTVNLSTQQLILILEICYPILNYFLQIGFKLLISNKVSTFFHQIATNSQESFTKIQELQPMLIQTRNIRCFINDLISLANTYQKFSQFMLKINEPGLQHCFISSNFNERYQNFITKSSEFNFIANWYELIHKSSQVKNYFKLNQYFLYEFLQFHMIQKKGFKEIFRGTSIVEELCEDFDQINLQENENLFAKIALDYFETKLFETNYELKYCKKMLQVFEICKKKKFLNFIFDRISSIRYLFNSLVYTKKCPAEIGQFLYLVTGQLSDGFSERNFEVVYSYLEVIFTCVCEGCFSRNVQDWRPSKMVEFLYQNIKVFNIYQNPYMVLNYFFCLQHQQFRHLKGQRFLFQIIKALPLLAPTARSLIIGNIYQYLFEVFYYSERQSFLNQKGITKQTIFQGFPKNELNHTVHRRFLYLIKRNIWNSTNQKQKLDKLVESAFHREKYFCDYKYPQIVRENYAQKVKRYFEVKENFKQDKNITWLKKQIQSDSIQIMDAQQYHKNFGDRNWSMQMVHNS